MHALSSPVVTSMRTATEPTPRSPVQPIANGDWLMLHYAAANMDPTPSRSDALRRHAGERRQAHRLRLRHPLLPRRAARPASNCVRCSRTSFRAWPREMAGGEATSKARSSAASKPCRSATPSRNHRDLIAVEPSRSRNCRRTLLTTQHPAPISGSSLKTVKFWSRSRDRVPMDKGASIATHRPPNRFHRRDEPGDGRATARFGTGRPRPHRRPAPVLRHRVR